MFTELTATLSSYELTPEIDERVYEGIDYYISNIPYDLHNWCKISIML